MNPNEMEFSKFTFYPAYLHKTDKALPVRWSFPKTWEEFNQSNSPYLFVRKPGEEFVGSENIVVFITKKGYEPFAEHHYLIYEDAHYERKNEKKAEKYWREAE